MAKFRRIAHSTAKVVGANTLTIQPILTPPFVKIVEGPPSLVGCALARLGHLVCGACKNFRAQQEPKYIFLKKSIWAFPNSHPKHL